MEKFDLKEELHLMCMTARSFPKGIGAAFDALIAMLPTINNRTFFGIFYPDEKGGMIYKAGVLKSFSGEEEKYGCETFIVEKGEYLTETLTDWKNHEEMIGSTFRKLGESRKDTIPPGVEWYQGEDVMCMIKLDESKA